MITTLEQLINNPVSKSDNGNLYSEWHLKQAHEFGKEFASLQTATLRKQNEIQALQIGELLAKIEAQSTEIDKYRNALKYIVRHCDRDERAYQIADETLD